MQMDAGLDTGDMLLLQSLPILDTDTTGSLHDKLAVLGGSLMVQALDQLQQAALQPQPQPELGITYAAKIDKHEALIDWTQPAATIIRRVRAFNPAPGASTTLNGETLKIWAAEVAIGLSSSTRAETLVCGQIVLVAQTHIAVTAMNSVVNITELQRPGGRRLAVADFLRGFDLQAGAVLGRD
jgi:methionyl-tRNA formyltransferase